MKSLSISAEKIMFSKFESIIFEQNVSYSSGDSKTAQQIESYWLESLDFSISSLDF